MLAVHSPIATASAVGFGSDDLRLGVGELLAVAAAEDTPESTLYASGNVVVIDPSLMLKSKVVEKGGLKIGVTSILDEESMEAKPMESKPVKSNSVG